MITNKQTIFHKFKKLPWVLLFFAFLTFVQNGQGQEVQATIDRDSILIGEQITYTLEVETDSTDLVFFPEGQTFTPLEMVEAYPTDTSFAAAKYKLIKKYALTQFDSGAYTIPRQRVSINEQPYFTDSLLVAVNNVKVDTTQQNLYDIKNIIEVESSSNDWLEYLLWILGILLLIGLFLFFVIRRSRKKAEAEKKLPPFEQALVSLQQFDENYKTPDSNADQTVIKAYYSSLTDIVRRYLDEEVYDRSMESTTSELITRLQQERQQGTVNFSKETLSKLEQILRTADLTKFARISPEVGKAQHDRLIAEQIVKETKESLPEPTEEELLKDENYRKDLAQRRRRKTILVSVFGVLFILIVAGGILVATKGFDFVKDNFLGHPSKELLDGDWVRSEYGFPPVVVSTPKVLKREDLLTNSPQQQMQMEVSTFVYGSYVDDFTVMVNNLTLRQEAQEDIDINPAIENALKSMSDRGVKNVLTKNEEYSTPEGAEGIKTFGSAEFPVSGNPEKFEKGEYIMLNFGNKKGIKQVMVVWRSDDQYGEEMANRIVNSVELINTSN
ncbi:MAG: hypothetical protein WBG71_06285 [Leeuwenhoekiella sp.]